MMTSEQLIGLERSLREQRVLSVYLRGATDDPAARLIWRTELDRSIRDLRRWLTGSSHEEREELERCVALLEELLDPYAAGLPMPGWVAFISDGVGHDAERLPVPMPTMAIWSTGMCVAPYVRALKVTRPVLVVLADARLVRVYRYRLGEIDLLETIHAHATIERPTHMGDAPRGGFHAGVRGETAREAVQRAHAAGTDRMLREAEVIIARHASLDGGVLVGGNSRVAAQLVQAIGRNISDRVVVLDALGAHASAAEIRDAAGVGASTLRDSADLRRITEIVRANATNGRTALGPAATRRALERQTVAELYVTGRYLEDHMAEAEDAVRGALDQGAVVEQVERAAAAMLDEHGGLAARLRYRVVEAPDDAGALAPNAAAGGSA
jgi:hypothetical protein